MIFAVATDERTLVAFPNEVEAVAACEGLDVEAAEWLFWNDSGEPLEPLFSVPNERGLFAGQHVDADLMRSYWAAWGDREAYAVSHVGWGMNPKARWDAMALYDKKDFNGTELRAFAGNFLYSTGANEVAGRHTLGHFDLPLRGCTVALDGQVIVDAGQLTGELA